ncbi:uncharacterized protein POS17_2695 [Pseudomonas sp. Os17]|uniref:DUF2357 domain-containing protein n=1 Tax=Pseudomonas sp. Os17 TaxID=1500686 RepID=UPI0005FC8316|nr:hypothetical protein [Pseudomonas sp. Os17]BAQ74389.1 uncharacterized protein POS17_2695 [Pseudomonas sp. Os17]
MLKLEFLSGTRKGEQAILNIASDEATSRPQIREDDVIKFTATLDREARVKLVLHEIQMYATGRRQEGESWIYEWSPGLGEYRHHCFFQNYYGLASLDLLIEDFEISHPISEYSSIVPSGSKELIEYQEIEVLAKNENASRVDAMISFLSSQDSNLIASVFRVTRLRAGFIGDEGRSDSQYLDRIEKSTKDLERVTRALFKSPIVKSRAQTRLVVPNEHSVPDDSTICWINDNTSEVYQTDDQLSSFFEIDDVHFNANKILETYVTTSSDCYENRVVHGYVVLLKRAVKAILDSMKSRKHVQDKEPPKGYASFFTQINKYSAIINKNKIQRCSDLDLRLGAILAKLKKLIPVSVLYLGVPQLTPKAKSNPAYREIFVRMIEFMRFGKPSWDVNDELLSITSVPKLFEYYCLFVVREKIEHFISIEDSTRSAINEITDNISKFSYAFRELTINLLYEPSYWTHGHHNSSSAQLINSEAWTGSKLQKFKYRSEPLVDFSIGKRGTTGPHARRSPDLVIQVEAPGRKTLSIIIDAKYTGNEKAFLDHLPALTMKYVHGIHDKVTGHQQTVALVIINPTSDTQERTRHFHSENYSIHGGSPVVPALLVSSLDFMTAELHTSDFHKNINKVLELVTSMQSVSEKEKIKLSIVA